MHTEAFHTVDKVLHNAIIHIKLDQCMPSNVVQYCLKCSTKLYPVLTEAKEECVDTHGIHTEEAMGNKVGAHHDRLCNDTHKILNTAVVCVFVSKNSIFNFRILGNAQESLKAVLM